MERNIKSGARESLWSWGLRCFIFLYCQEAKTSERPGPSSGRGLAELVYERDDQHIAIHPNRKSKFIV